MSYAVRLHGVQFPCELFGKGLGNFFADVNTLFEILLGVRTPDFFVQSRFQLIEILFREVDARRLRMPAEFGNILRAIFERIENIDVFDAAGTSLQHIAVMHEQERGTIVFFGDSRRDDPDEPGIPALVGKHDDVTVSSLFRKFRLCGGIQLVAAFLTFGVVGAQFCRKVQNFAFVLGNEQLKGGARVSHSPRGIDARSNRKRQILRGHGVVRFSHQRGKTASRARRIEQFQPLGHNVPIFSEERNAVRDGRQSGKVQ